MRIALRTSGGRGEYEIAGRQGHVRNSDLFDHTIDFRLAPELLVPGHSILRHYQGKPRIRLESGKDAVHSYRLLSAILLLPKPIREFRKTGEGSEVLRAEHYSLIGVDVDVARVTATRATLCPRTIYVANRGGAALRISFTERLARVMKLWQIAEAKTENDIALDVLNHREQILAAPDNHNAIERAASVLRTKLGDGDILDAAFMRLGEGGLSYADEEVSHFDPGNLPEGWDAAEDEPPDSFEAASEELRKWRQVAVRGSSGRRFSAEVKMAYNDTCLFSGLRLPAVVPRGTTGVDAAHILPWATHRINEISNGICLSKLCHWAFDTSLLTLHWHANEYVLTVPNRVKSRAIRNGVDIAYFCSLEGKVSVSRLPTSKGLWPSPRYLRKLKELQGL